jgi:hypothetical protein
LWRLVGNAESTGRIVQYSQRQWFRRGGPNNRCCGRDNVASDCLARCFRFRVLTQLL